MQTLVAGPREHLTESVVLDALSLAHGPRVRWGVHVLDQQDRLEGDESIPVESGSVTWSYRPPEAGAGGRDRTKAAEVRRRAQLNLAGDLGGLELLAHRYQPWVELQASTGEWVPWHLGVFVATNPPVADDGRKITRPLRLADKSYRWANRVLTDTLTVTAGTNPVEWVRDRLASEFGETKVLITTTETTMDDARVFEAGTSELVVMNTLLEQAAFEQLTVDEEGRPRSVPLADLAGRGIEWTYAPGAGKILVAGDVEPLLPTLPNVVRFVARQGPSLPEEGNGYVTVTNQSTGPASIDQRGEEVWLSVDVDAEDQPELDEIAAAEAHRYFAGGGLRFKGQVGLNPAHSDRDVIGLEKVRLDVSGSWFVTEWTLPLEHQMGESAVLMDIIAEQRVAVT